MTPWKVHLLIWNNSCHHARLKMKRIWVCSKCLIRRWRRCNLSLSRITIRKRYFRQHLTRDLCSWRSRGERDEGCGVMSSRYVLGDMVDGRVVELEEDEEEMNNGKKVKLLGKSIWDWKRYSRRRKKLKKWKRLVKTIKDQRRKLVVCLLFQMLLESMSKVNSILKNLNSITSTKMNKRKSINSN